MAFSKQELERMAGAVPFWFHSIDLGQGVITNGWKTAPQLAGEFQRFPELRGRTVLDINAWDGYFSFAAERAGAQRVVALDQYMWSMDLAEHRRYWQDCKASGVTPAPYHTMPYYKPGELPGKIGFDTAHRAIKSGVETVVGDFMEMNLEPLGQYDVVLYLGSLYHMENPLEAMRRVSRVTKEVAIVETEAAAFQGIDDRALCEFFPSDELNGDVSNWWAPNQEALVGLCKAAGFNRVDTLVGPPRDAAHSSPNKSLPGQMRAAVKSTLRRLSRGSSPNAALNVTRYRAIVHAWK